VKIGAAALGGYVLGRTKKGKAAIGLAFWLAGRKRPADMARDSAVKLLRSDRGQELLGELRGPVLTAGRQAALSVFEAQAGRIGDAMQRRTESLGGSVPVRNGSRGKRDEDEEDDRYEDEYDDEADEDDAEADEDESEDDGDEYEDEYDDDGDDDESDDESDDDEYEDEYDDEADDDESDDESDDNEYEDEYDDEADDHREDDEDDGDRRDSRATTRRRRRRVPA
jgi:hypothetical protein